MEQDKVLEKCEFYPSDEEINISGPFCDCGSDVSGSICTKEEGETCQWAIERREWMIK